MEVDEDDAVVEEIPVYLCKELSENLYLFQLPCRSADSSQFTKNIASSRVKPDNGIIELDCVLDTDSPHYDKWVGCDLASDNCCTKQNPKEKYEDRLMDILTLQSQRSILKKDISCYSVASLSDEKFCISTLRDSVSFLPTYQHRETTKKSGRGDRSDSESSAEDEKEESAPAVQVTVKFSQKNTERTKVSQELSHQHYLLKAAEEPWCTTTFYNNTSSTSIITMEGLKRTVAKNRTPMISLTEKQYLDVLIPPDTSDVIK